MAKTLSFFFRWPALAILGWFIYALLVALRAYVWLGAPPDLAIQVPFARPPSLLVFGILAADSLLDGRGAGRWVLVGWLGVSGLIVYAC